MNIFIAPAGTVRKWAAVPHPRIVPARDNNKTFVDLLLMSTLRALCEAHTTTAWAKMITFTVRKVAEQNKVT